MFGLMLIKLIHSNQQRMRFFFEYRCRFSMKVISRLTIPNTALGYQRRPAKDDFL